MLEDRYDKFFSENSEIIPNECRYFNKLARGRRFNIPKEDWEIKMIKISGDDYILASTNSYNGYRNWDKYHPSELPNYLITKEDLERFGIEL